ncbi:MAG: hypothetical protein K2Q23_04140, partial [Bryobacteraceae bacterium]|nr:hypothetical protein [Bryobacteraceae bacterium]
ALSALEIGVLSAHTRPVEFTKQLAEVKSTITEFQQQVNGKVVALEGQVTAVKEDAAKIATTAAQGASQRAQILASRHADNLIKNYAKKEEETNLKMAEAISQELSQVKAATSDHSTKLTDVRTDVGNIRADVSSTRTELEKTIAELRRTTGDLGVMSGLIATNSSELKALREMGDRNYFEFRLPKNSKPARVGDVMMVVKKVDPKRSRYTVELVADDKKIEKKDKTVNEPVQFYVASKARVPYEIVVNEVTKDTVIGYLSTPKVQVARN